MYGFLETTVKYIFASGEKRICREFLTNPVKIKWRLGTIFDDYT